MSELYYLLHKWVVLQMNFKNLIASLNTISTLKNICLVDLNLNSAYSYKPNHPFVYIDLTSLLKVNGNTSSLGEARADQSRVFWQA